MEQNNFKNTLLSKATYKKLLILDMRTQRAATLLNWTAHLNIKNNDRALMSGVKLPLCRTHILQKLSQGSCYMSEIRLRAAPKGVRLEENPGSSR